MTYVQSRLRLSLLIGLGVFGIAVVDSLIRAPDTIDGVAIPGYLWIRVIASAFIAAMCVLGCYLGFRVGKAARLSLLTGVAIVVLYAVFLYIPTLPLALNIDRTGDVQSPGGEWWSLVSPFVLPFVLALIVPRLPMGRR
jgi:hypothetical protein